ncbi:MAG: N-6 DNA methylase [Planctomycetota bacterium]
MNLSSTIKSIQDIMRKDDGVDGDAQRIGQLTWMLFLKIFDQCEETWEDDAEDRGATYVSPLPEKCRWRNWAAYKNGKPQKPAKELLEHVNNLVFPKLKEVSIDLYSGRSKAKREENETLRAKAKVVREVFRDANNYMKSGTLMLAVIEKFDEAIDFHDIKKCGQMGQIYEQILNDLRSAGNAGEFYTPRAVTEFMIQMLNPSLKKREVILDPACGTGGFLTAAIDHFENQITKKSSPDDRKAIANCIRGIEKKQLPHLLCTTNLLLHHIDVPSMVEHENTLKLYKDWPKSDAVMCVASNPPFGGMEEDVVGSDFPADLQTKETADMFLVFIVKKMLREKGRGAVVLPDGTLFGEGVKNKIKELLMRECHLHTIIRLPKGVFNPYTGIKTNLLFFTKGKPTDTIWFYEHHYPEGVKSYSKTKPLRIDELQPIAQWWGKESNGFKDRVETEQAWKVDFRTLKEEATAKAQPHWDKAESLTNEANALNEQTKALRASMKGKGRKPFTEWADIEERIEILSTQIETLRQQAKDEQAIGDRHYWPIYNLDIKNPNAPEEESHDPDVLLAKYKTLLGEIENTKNQLRNELAAALSHHFKNTDSAS